jgi:SAM-dependent methyltransferase
LIGSSLGDNRLRGGTALKLAQTSYDLHAADYARLLDPFLAGAVERLVDLSGARPGMDILDIATGTGSAARAAASRGASVVAVDLSPAMVAIATERSPGEGTVIPATQAIREIRDRYGQSAVDDGLDEATWLRTRSGSEVLRKAGFEEVVVETETFTGTFASADEAFNWSLAWPVAGAKLAQLDAGARDSFLEDARRALTSSDLSWRFVFNLYVGRAPAP